MMHHFLQRFFDYAHPTLASPANNSTIVRKQRLKVSEMADLLCGLPPINRHAEKR